MVEFGRIMSGCAALVTVPMQVTAGKPRFFRRCFRWRHRLRRRSCVEVVLTEAGSLQRF